MNQEDVKAKLPGWLEAKFAGCTKPELRAACLAAEIGSTSTDTIESMTRKLLQHYNCWDEPSAPPARAGAMVDLEARLKKPRAAKAAPATSAPAPRGEDPFGFGSRRPPVLNSLRRWQGKRYRCRALPMSKEKGGARRFAVPWEGEVFLFDPKLQYQDVPAPVFENLMDSQERQLALTWNPEQKQMDRVWNTYARFSLQFMGVTPGTEHLPSSLHEWLVRDAAAHDNYNHESRDTLERIWGLLTDGAHPTQTDRDREIGYWRRQIQQLLGTTPEQIEAQQEALEQQAAA